MHVRDPPRRICELRSRLVEAKVRFGGAATRLGHVRTRVGHAPTPVGHDQTRVTHERTRLTHERTRLTHDRMPLGHDRTRLGHDQTHVGGRPTCLGGSQRRTCVAHARIVDGATRLAKAKLCNCVPQVQSLGAETRVAELEMVFGDVAGCSRQPAARVVVNRRRLVRPQFRSLTRSKPRSGADACERRAQTRAASVQKCGRGTELRIARRQRPPTSGLLRVNSQRPDLPDRL
jgi:hypothetical protein